MPEPANAGARDFLASALTPACCIPGATRAPAHPALVALHSIGLGAQALLVGWIAAPSGGPPLLIALVFAALAALVPLALARPALRRPWLSMLTLGGLGMTAGWWIDLGAPGPFAAARDFAASSVWCASPDLATHAGGHVHLISWMNAGMLLLGVPVMMAGWRERNGGPPPGASSLARRVLGLGLCALAMLAGMMAGAAAIDALLQIASPGVAAARLALWAGMTAGMLASMALTHRLGRCA